MQPLLFRWGLEAVDVYALWIDAGHDVLDRAVFSGRVERLKNDDDGIFAAGPQHVLRGGQARNVFQQRRLGLFFIFEAGRVRGVKVLQTYLLSGWNEKVLVVQTVRGCHETGLRSVDVHGPSGPAETADVRDILAETHAACLRWANRSERTNPAVGQAFQPDVVTKRVRLKA